MAQVPYLIEVVAERTLQMKQRPGRREAGRRKTERKHKTREDDSFAFDEEVSTPELDPASELPGSVYMVPDKFWGFQAVGRIEHPGLCTQCDIPATVATLLKGTDANRIRGAHGYWITAATQSNGLKKSTAFQLQPHRFPLRRVLLMHENRCVGRLEDSELRKLQRELERLFPSDE
jgi:hypothetical protein